MKASILFLKRSLKNYVVLTTYSKASPNFKTKRGWWQRISSGPLGNGLALLVHTKWLPQLRTLHVQSYFHKWYRKEILADRGFMAVHLEIKANRFIFINTHLTAYPFKYKTRIAQLFEIVSYLEQQTFDFCLLAGDFNFRPYDPEYEHIKKMNFIDCEGEWQDLRPPGYLENPNPLHQITWSEKNRYHDFGEPAGKLDYFFLYATENLPQVTHYAMDTIVLSDHYPISMELEVS